MYDWGFGVVQIEGFTGAAVWQPMCMMLTMACAVSEQVEGFCSPFWGAVCGAHGSVSLLNGISLREIVFCLGCFLSHGASCFVAVARRNLTNADGGGGSFLCCCYAARCARGSQPGL